jgi:hypothetical protein
MLKPKMTDSRPIRASLRLYQRHVAFPKSDDCAGIVVGKKFAKPPHTTRVARVVRHAPFQPSRLQIGRIEFGRFNCYLEQVAANRARKCAIVQVQLGFTTANAAPEIRHELQESTPQQFTGYVAGFDMQGFSFKVAFV